MIFRKIKKINWSSHHNSLPFNDSALALYEWSPIADELKTLDRKNSFKFYDFEME